MSEPAVPVTEGDEHATIHFNSEYLSEELQDRMAFLVSPALFPNIAGGDSEGRRSRENDQHDYAGMYS